MALAQAGSLQFDPVCTVHDAVQDGVSAASGAPVMGFAGLRDRWRHPVIGGQLSCTIIVCGASQWMEKYRDRMPVILEPANFDGWLKGTVGVEVLRCAP